jgi:hypothetical protein
MSCSWMCGFWKQFVKYWRCKMMSSSLFGLCKFDIAMSRALDLDVLQGEHFTPRLTSKPGLKRLLRSAERHDQSCCSSTSTPRRWATWQVRFLSHLFLSDQQISNCYMYSQGLVSPNLLPLQSLCAWKLHRLVDVCIYLVLGFTWPSIICYMSFGLFCRYQLVIFVVEFEWFGRQFLIFGKSNWMRVLCVFAIKISFVHVFLCVVFFVGQLIFICWFIVWRF